MKALLALVLVIVAVVIGYSVYETSYGENRLVVVQYTVQPGDSQISIGEHFSNDALSASKVIYESANYRGIIEPKAYEAIKVVTTHSRYNELVNQGEKIKLLVD